MGNSESPHAEKPEQQVINHQKFLNATLTKDNDYIAITLPIENDTDFYTWQKNLNSITELDDQTFLLPKAYQYERNSICGRSGSLKIQFDNFPYILHDEIENRRAFEKHFQEEQIWYLLYSLITSAYRFHRMNKKVGDIRPKNIFINESGQVKVTNFYSWPNQQTNVSKTMIDKTITFISPEEMQQINVGRVETIIDKQLAESFSVGLTVLNTGLLDRVESIYNTVVYKCDTFHLEKKLNKWMKLEFRSEERLTQGIIQYSNPLKEVVIALCETNPKNRVSCSEIYRWLEPFDEQIVNLQPFQIGRPPVKKIRLNYDARTKTNDLIELKTLRYPLNAKIVGNSQEKVQQNLDMMKTASLQKQGSNPYQNSRNSQQTANINPSQKARQSHNQFRPVELRPNSYHFNQVPKTSLIGNANGQVSMNSHLAFNIAHINQIKGLNAHLPNQNVGPLARQSQNQQISSRIPKQLASRHQSNYTTKFQTRETYTASTGDSDFLKRINEQLMISQKMYP